MDASLVFQDLTADETAFLEASLVRRREIIALAGKTGHGHVLSACEEAAFDMAQATARELLLAGINTTVAEVEKKVDPREGVSAAVVGVIAAPTLGRC